LRRLVTIKADKPSAEFAFIPLRAPDGQPQPEKAVRAKMDGQRPIEIRVPPGDYLVVAFLGDPETTGEFHEVFRRVPGLDEPASQTTYAHEESETDARGVVTLTDVKIFSTSEVVSTMASVPEYANFPMGSEALPEEAPLHHRRVPAFFLDTTE